MDCRRRQARRKVRQESHDCCDWLWIRSPNPVQPPVVFTVESIRIVSQAVPVPMDAAIHWLARNGFRELCLGIVALWIDCTS